MGCGPSVEQKARHGDAALPKPESGNATEPSHNPKSAMGTASSSNDIKAQISEPPNPAEGPTKSKGSTLRTAGAQVAGSFTGRTSNSVPRAPRESDDVAHHPLESSGNGNSNGNGNGQDQDQDHLVAEMRKLRRLAAGTNVMRDELKRLAIGGTAVGGEDTMEVSDSDDDEVEMDNLEEDRPELVKNEKTKQFLMGILSKHFIFRGLSSDLLENIISTMDGVCLPSGGGIVEQGRLPGPFDCMYVVESGTVEVTVAGGGGIKEMMAGGGNKEGLVVETSDHVLRIRKESGWVFGDMTLLFNSPRSATVKAVTQCTLWVMKKSTFMAIVMKHADGARALRFVRKLPLLKGLSDNVLFDVAERMTEEVYQDGEAIIKYGERGQKLFLVRYGKVKIMIPNSTTGKFLEVNQMGRGHFLGERTLITNKLRSADCVANGTVRVVVMQKIDFLRLDNPLLGWMLDYDAMSTVLKSLSQMHTLTNDVLESVIDRFEREEYPKGAVVAKKGDLISRLTVVKMGEVAMPGGEDEIGFVSESPGGFCYFGETCLQSKSHYPADVIVTSDSAQILTIHRKEMANLITAVRRVSSRSLMQQQHHAKFIDAMKSSKALAGLTDKDMQSIVDQCEMVSLTDGELLAHHGDPATELSVVVGGRVTICNHASAGGNVTLENQVILESEFLEGLDHKADVVASGGAEVIVCREDKIKEALGMDLVSLLQIRRTERKAKQNSIPITALEMHRVVGTGQFGMVRMVTHKQTKEVYALKAMVKCSKKQRKQHEHIINERLVLEVASKSPFCTKLLAAYQDSAFLYMLQEWVPGGELFYHLDLMGAFDEHMAKFYAASVLLALGHLHKRGIVYRDLKPENLLIDAQGHVKLADFGFAKKIGKEKTFTICGTPDYQSPEVIMRKGTGPASDYWAVGVLIFEMLVGDPPFASLSGDPWDTFRRIMSGRFQVPDFVSKDAADIIYSLLQTDMTSRLGYGPNGLEAIMSHRWFENFDWEALLDHKMKAPIVPTLKNPTDTSNFDQFGLEDAPTWARHAPVPLKDEEQEFPWDLWEWIDDQNLKL